MQNKERIMYNPWNKARAQSWYQQQPWGCGFNYLPRTAVNWLEMWQAESFDSSTIDQELGWASQYGYNQLRTNLPFTVWQYDRDGLLERINLFLSIAHSHRIKVMLTLLDDCAFPVMSRLSASKNRRFRIHNSQGGSSPGRACVLIDAVGRTLKPMSEISSVIFVTTRGSDMGFVQRTGQRRDVCHTGKFARYDTGWKSMRCR
jgi:hypothetical protein